MKRTVKAWAAVDEDGLMCSVNTWGKNGLWPTSGSAKIHLSTIAVHLIGYRLVRCTITYDDGMKGRKKP